MAEHSDPIPHHRIAAIPACRQKEAVDWMAEVGAVARSVAMVAAWWILKTPALFAPLACLETLLEKRPLPRADRRSLAFP